MTDAEIFFSIVVVVVVVVVFISLDILSEFSTFLSQS